MDLSIQKQLIINQLRNETKAYIESRYSLERQNAFQLLAVDALISNLANRGLYIKQMRDWIYSVLHYHFSLVSDINAADQTSLSRMNSSFSRFDALDPNTSIETALSIDN